MNMKKIHIITLAFIFLIYPLSASLRNETDARQVAINYLSNYYYFNGRQKAPSSNNLQLAYIHKEKDVNEGKNLLYIYNTGENDGFVVVSGSDKASNILGYAHTGTFDANKIPDGLNFWLNGFAEEIKLLEESPELFSIDGSFSNETKIKAPSSILFSSSISPLLGGIKWNQGEPYNNLCPVIPTTSKLSVTGCVATGMAQVMKYHQWPVNGTGSNSYTTETHKIPLSVDFSTTTYDWANMTHVYNVSSTETQKTAIATLMYHCGVATNMNYDESSGTTTLEMATALIDHFGYDPNLNLLKRDFYTRSEWINLLKTELNASRPVLYGGQSSTSGHLFVCDGYDTNDFFHFNWGWGGLSDGYYAISALNPSSQGAGGGSSGYNSDQDIVIGMQKPNPASSPIYIIYMQENISSSKQKVQRNDTTTIFIKKTYNYGVNTFSGNLGLGLFDGDNLVAIVRNYNIPSLNPYYGITYEKAENIKIPSQVANGKYKLHIIYKPSGESNWSIVRGRIVSPNFLYVQVSDTEVSYTEPSDYGPKLTLNSISTIGNVYQNKTGRFTVEVTNTGEEYNSKLGIYLQSKENPSVYQMITDYANIGKNETASFNINKKIILDPGEYNIQARYDINNGQGSSTFVQLGSTQTINILATPTDPPVFKLNSKISFPDNEDVNKDFDILSANISNTGGFYENKMIAFVFSLEWGKNLTYIGYQDVFFDSNEQKNVSFSGSINLDPGQYYIVTYYRGESDWIQLTPENYSGILFTIQQDYTAIEQIPKTIDHLYIYPNPTTNYISFKSEQVVDEILLYTIEGKLIKNITPNMSGIIRVDTRNLKKGSYLLQVNASGKLKIGQFIKQ